MAVATYAERIALDLAILISNDTLIDLSRQRDATATENTARTTRVSQMAAAKIESRLGAAGNYDTTDTTVGKQIFIEFGVRYAILLYSSIYTFTFSDSAKTTLDDLKAEIEEYRGTLITNASTPVVGTRDNDDLNNRYTNDWETEAID